MAEPSIGSAAVKTVWPDRVADLPVLAANQFLLQLSGVAGRIDEVILTFGHAVPPILLGGDAAERLAEIGQIEVKPVARFSITRDRVPELVALFKKLTDALEASANIDAEADS